jgi:mTERF domain-containing protein
LKFPRLMTNSLVKIKHVVGYLRFELGLEANDVRRILYQAPQVVSLRSETIDGKVDFLLQAAAPGATRKSPSSTTILRRLIVGMPTLLYLSIDKNMGPKVAYLRDQLGTEALSSALDRLPMLLGYSLDKRIQPRLEKILNAGVDGGSITVGITMKEEAFDAWLVGRSRKAELGVTTGRARKTKGKAIKTKPAKDLALEPQEEGEEDARGRVVQEGGRIVHWVRRS